MAITTTARASVWLCAGALVCFCPDPALARAAFSPAVMAGHESLLCAAESATAAESPSAPALPAPTMEAPEEAPAPETPPAEPGAPAIPVLQEPKRAPGTPELPKYVSDMTIAFHRAD